MTNVGNFLQFVKDQIDFQNKMLARYTNEPYRLKLHSATRDKFIELYEEIERTVEEANNQSAGDSTQNKPIRLSLSQEDLHGIPEELLSELSISDGDKTEFAILNLIEEAGGIISLDRLLVGLYRKTKEVHKRQTLTSKLYRMAQKELVFSVPAKKGVYSNRRISESESAILFGSGGKQYVDPSAFSAE